MKRLLLALLGSAFGVVLGACPAPPGRDLVVLVGAGNGSTSINAFLPETVRVRVGDTVTWKMNADGDPHAVTFIRLDAHFPDIIPPPGAGPEDLVWNPQLLVPTREPGDPVEVYSGAVDEFANSGTFFGAVAPFIEAEIPRFDDFSLKFGKPGSYQYICIIHEFMRGTIIAEPAAATGLPTQEEIDAQAVEELAPLKRLTDGFGLLLARGHATEQEPGPGDTSVWIVSSGLGPREAEVAEFFPKQLAVQEGDTVVWYSSRFHAVVFDEKGEPLTRFYRPRTFPTGNIALVINPDVVFPRSPVDKSPGEYDGTGFYSSGVMGPGITGREVRPGRMGWSLTFTEPGVYSYTCPIHLAVGMTGTITVEPR